MSMCVFHACVYVCMVTDIIVSLLFKNDECVCLHIMRVYMCVCEHGDIYHCIFIRTARILNVYVYICT